MTPATLAASVSKPVPPDSLAPPLQALWWAAKGDWDKAHKIVMEEDGADAAWVHAYLHRVEGDLPNARYWYAQARRKPASGELQPEWDSIAAALLDRENGRV